MNGIDEEKNLKNMNGIDVTDIALKILSIW